MQLSFLLDRARPHYARLGLISLLALLGSASSLTIPWLAGQLLGGILTSDRASFGLIVAGLCAGLVATTLLAVAVQVISAGTSARILAELRFETYAWVQRLPMGFHDRSRRGDLLALMTWEVTNLSTFLSATLTTAPAMLFTAAGAMILLLLIDPVLALFLPLLLPLLLIIPKLVGRRLRRLGAQLRKAEAALTTAAESHLQMIAATKSFAMEDRQAATYARLAEQSRGITVQMSAIQSAVGPLIALAGALAVVALLVFGGKGLADGGRGAGDLFSFLLYAGLLTRPLGSLVDFYGRYQMAKGTLSRLQAVFRENQEAGHGGDETMPRAAGRIAFEAVDFAYSGRGPVLRGASLAVAPGEIVALVGENGAGKTTLIKLLLRFYEPGSGRITLDGCDIAGLPVRALRRQIGHVSQHGLLFDGTVRENILFADPGADETALERALDLSQAREFIAGLPRGLDTRIGDEGVRISGGQRQRISLARALLADPPILVLDEATSMYDLESEAAFIEACRGALKGRTVILITHRPASLALADRILMVADGAVSPAD